MIGVYMIINPKGRIYVGQSKDVEKRFKQYKYGHFKKQRRLYNSIKKYGFESHVFRVLCECKELDLNEKERYYQEKHEVLGSNGLNCELVSSKNAPRKLSEESKRRISIKNKGSKNGMHGKKMSDEFKKARRSYKHTEESLKKISNRSTRGKNPNAKLVLCLSTGIFYECIADAAEAINLPYDRVKQWLNGRRNNKSSLRVI